MKSKDVLKILKVTRPTLYAYVKSGKLKVTPLVNGTYEYDDSVYDLVGIDKDTHSEQKVRYRIFGKRIKRGLYRTKNRSLINADVNGSYNILRKEVGDELYQLIEGLCLTRDQLRSKYLLKILYIII